MNVVDDELPSDLPGHARLLGDFVNTAERQVGRETLDRPERLRDWAADRGVLGRRARLGPEDLTAALVVREGLREVLATHAGHAADAASVAAMDRVLAGAPVRLVLDDPAGPRLAPAGDRPVDVLLGALVDAVERARADHTWERLKVCGRDTCRWAFYDASRNRSGRWCSMAGCGNAVKMRRAYAARKARAQQG